jgi:GAF domain-containing protein
MAHGEMFNAVKGSVPVLEEKISLYENAHAAIITQLSGERDAMVIFSTIIAVLHHSMPHYFWTGIYRVTGDQMAVGPYQGTPACLHIAHGRGVCGTAWAEARTIVVANVHDFPGHIACDARSASEIVVPWKNKDGEVIAVLDVDSTIASAFDEIDAAGLEKIIQEFPIDSFFQAVGDGS